MKSSVLILYFVLVGSLKADVLFFDSFDGATIDETKWDIVLPNNVTSSISVQDGYLKSLNRGTVVTKQEFNSPYIVTGLFRTSALYYDLTTITLRSSGLLPSSLSWGLVEGIAIEIWSDGYYITPYEFGLNAGPPSEYKPSIAIEDNQIYSFQILDTGSTFSVSINNQEIFTRATSFSTGGKIGFSSREYNGTWNDTGRSDLLQIQVESVPEPSTVLLSAAGLGGIAIMRKRKR